MPVVINEFEVVAASPSATAPKSEGPPEKAASKKMLTPQEIENIIRRQKERLLRIWAH
ncbi:hypothetical protein L0Z72_15310 [candidate division KSB1 bacterium]|nr:hypothetical protein [candidate division KSB1 bacterium]